MSKTFKIKPLQSTPHSVSSVMQKWAKVLLQSSGVPQSMYNRTKPRPTHPGASIGGEKFIGTFRYTQDETAYLGHRYVPDEHAGDRVLLLVSGIHPHYHLMINASDLTYQAVTIAHPGSGWVHDPHGRPKLAKRTIKRILREVGFSNL